MNRESLPLLLFVKLNLNTAGNQSDKKPGDGPGNRTICTNPIKKSKFTGKNVSKRDDAFWLVAPPSYINLIKGLPKLNADGKELSYEDTHNP